METELQRPEFSLVPSTLAHTTRHTISQNCIHTYSHAKLHVHTIISRSLKITYKTTQGCQLHLCNHKMSHTITQSQSHSHTITHTQSRAQLQTVAHRIMQLHTITITYSHAQSCTIMHTMIYTITRSHNHTITLTITQSHTHSHTHTQSQTHNAASPAAEVLSSFWMNKCTPIPAQSWLPRPQQGSAGPGGQPQ